MYIKYKLIYTIVNLFSSKVWHTLGGGVLDLWQFVTGGGRGKNLSKLEWHTLLCYSKRASVNLSETNNILFCSHHKFVSISNLNLWLMATNCANYFIQVSWCIYHHRPSFRLSMTYLWMLEKIPSYCHIFLLWSVWIFCTWF